jgi:uncharacterized protein with FMN-binding domain
MRCNFCLSKIKVRRNKIMHMKKLFLAGFVIAVFVLYSIFHYNSVAVAPVSANKNNSTTATTVSTNSSQISYKDGTYTGSAADAFYGTMQVQAIVKNGKIADVQFLQYPNDRDESVQINQQAMPMLKQEAIQAQSANVDIVSGATDSSQAFMQSLASALSQAKS